MTKTSCLLQAISEPSFSVAYANMCRCLVPVSIFLLINSTMHAMRDIKMEILKILLKSPILIVLKKCISLVMDNKLVTKIEIISYTNERN